MSIKYESYTFKQGAKTWKRRFSCLTEAVEYLNILNIQFSTRIFNAKDERLYPPVPGEVLP